MEAARIVSQDESHVEAMGIIREHAPYASFSATRYDLSLTEACIVFHNLHTGDYTLSTATANPPESVAY